MLRKPPLHRVPDSVCRHGSTLSQTQDMFQFCKAQTKPERHFAMQINNDCAQFCHYFEPKSVPMSRPSLAICSEFFCTGVGWGLKKKRRPSAGTSLSFRSRKRFLQGNANAFTVELVNAFRRCHIQISKQAVKTPPSKMQH